MSISLPYINFEPILPFEGDAIRLCSEIITNASKKKELITTYTVKHVKTSILPGETNLIEGVIYKFNCDDSEKKIWTVTIIQSDN